MTEDIEALRREIANRRGLVDANERERAEIGHRLAVLDGVDEHAEELERARQQAATLDAALERDRDIARRLEARLEALTPAREASQ